MNSEEIDKKIAEAQQYLNNTDYILIKIKEYEITGQEITEDYSEILEKREESRQVIRKYRNKDGDE